MIFQCLNPGCGGTEFVLAKDANPVIGYVNVLGRWKKVVRGETVICLRCECSMVKTRDSAYLTQRSMRVIQTPRNGTPVVPMGSQEPVRKPEPVYPIELEP